MKKAYFGLTEFLDTNLLSILLGFVSGFEINVLTSNSINNCYLVVLLFGLISIVTLVILLRIRQIIDSSYKSRENEIISPQQKWRNSSGFDNKNRVTLFFVSFFLLVVSSTILLISFYLVSQREKLNLAKEKADFEQRLHNIDSINNKSNLYLNNIKSSIDSIHEILKKQ